MKTHKFILLALSTLLLVGCGESSTSSSTSSSSSSTSSSTTSSSSTSSSSSSSSSSSVTSSSSTTSVDPAIDLGEVTIAQARAYCFQYVKDLNSHELGVNMNYKVTIKGLAINRFDLIKTKASFGLDVSKPAKVIFGDSSGYIACASSTGDGTLFDKVSNYSGEATSSYSVTGYLSIYLGQPELYVPSNTFTWNSSLGITFDAMSQHDGVISVSEYYTLAKAIKYNCAGHGYGKIVRMNDVLCIAKDYDGGCYSFTDGYQIFKAIPYKANSLAVGSKYNLAGMITTKNWSPALRIMKSSSSSATIVEDYLTPVTKSVSDLNKIIASQEDTDTRFDSYIDLYAHIYSCTAYASYYVVNSKYYVTISETLYTGSEITSANSAHEKGMIALENHDCWNISYNELVTYCSLKEYLCIDGEHYQQSFTVKYLPWQLTYHKSGKVYPHWKINLLEETITPSI